jgi:hypothetical protein
VIRSVSGEKRGTDPSARAFITGRGVSRWGCHTVEIAGIRIYKMSTWLSGDLHRRRRKCR